MFSEKSDIHDEKNVNTKFDCEKLGTQMEWKTGKISSYLFMTFIATF